jgi:CheY-like chemotaxis protein
MGFRGGLTQVNTVLLVDDDDNLREMLKRVLTGVGYEVHEAHNGKEASLVYLQQQPDLVITDIVMPDAEGLGFISEVRQNSRKVKIIAISGGGFGAANQYLRFAQRMGANYTLEKPFTTEELLSIVDLAIGADLPSLAAG